MIYWVESDEHGRHPCEDKNELEQFLKVGWREIGPPPWDKKEKKKISHLRFSRMTDEDVFAFLPDGREVKMAGIHISDFFIEDEEGDEIDLEKLKSEIERFHFNDKYIEEILIEGDEHTNTYRYWMPEAFAKREAWKKTKPAKLIDPLEEAQKAVKQTVLKLPQKVNK